MAYFLLTGVPPFVRRTAAETAAAHVHEVVIPPDEIQPGVPRDLQAIVLRCLSKNPDQRFQSVDALNNALTSCLISPP